MRILKQLVFWAIALFVSIQLYSHSNTIANTLALSESIDLNLLSQILATLCWCIGFIIINLLVNYYIWDKLASRRLGTLAPVLLKIISAFFIGAIIISIIITSVFGKSLTAFLALSGGIGLVLGIALQHSIVDFFSGIILHLEKPFRIGDFIMLNNTRLGDEPLIGKVSSIDWRTSRLVRTNGNTIIVPNNQFTKLVLTNFSLPDERSRMEIEYCIGFEFETERVCDIILTALFSVDSIQDYKAPKVKVSATTLNGAIYQVRYWISPDVISPGRSRDYVNRSVIKYLRYAGITMAYEKTDIYHTPMETRITNHEEQIRALVSNIPIFKSLSEENIGFLISQLVERSYHKGATIVNQDTNGDAMYILSEGFASILVQTDNDREAKIVGKVGPGQFFGEMSLVLGEVRSASVRAEKECKLYELNKSTLKTLFEKDPNLLQHIVQVIDSRKLKNEGILSAINEEETEVRQKNIMDKIEDFFKSF